LDKRLVVISVVLVTIFLGFGIIIPIMPEVIKDADAGTFHLGMLLAVYSAVSFLISPYWGALSDRIGRRPVIMMGVLGFSISFFIFGLAGDNLVLMYVSRILGGLFSGATTACAVAYVADITSEENRTKGMGLVGMSIGLGFIFGPALGGLLSHYGNATPFFIAAGLSMLTLLFVSRMLPESLSAKERAEAGMPKEKRSRWTAFSGTMKYLYVLSFFVSFTLAGLESTLQFFEMERFGATPTDMGIMFLVSGIAGAVIQGGVVRRMVKKGDEPRVVQIGLILSAAGFFALMFSYNLLTATIYLTIFACGNALIRPCVTSLITQKTKVGQGVATGLSSSMDSLGRIAGPLLATGMFGIRIDLPFLIGGALSLAALLLIIRFTALDRTQTEQAAM
jgi:MFS transporter, DHA1 family, multidrug resistance protein